MHNLLYAWRCGTFLSWVNIASDLTRVCDGPLNSNCLLLTQLWEFKNNFFFISIWLRLFLPRFFATLMNAFYTSWPIWTYPSLTRLPLGQLWTVMATAMALALAFRCSVGLAGPKPNWNSLCLCVCVRNCYDTIIGPAIAKQSRNKNKIPSNAKAANWQTRLNYQKKIRLICHLDFGCCSYIAGGLAPAI